MPKKILGAAVGSCVHVAGVISFLRLAEDLGHTTDFLGPAVGIADIVASLVKHENTPLDFTA